MTVIYPLIEAENPCELNCIPRGENFFFRHRSAAVDGTQCHPGRKDICVEGVCKVGTGENRKATRQLQFANIIEVFVMSAKKTFSYVALFF